jgi:hypothetical protein
MKFSDFQESKFFAALGGGALYAFTENLAANFGIGGMIQKNDKRDSFFVVKGGVTYVFSGKKTRISKPKY